MAGISTVNRSGGLQPDFPAEGRVAVLVKLAIFAIIVAALYFGSDILVPLALAMLLAFALAPPVRWLRKLHVPNVAAVLAVVTVAFVAILAFIWVITLQATDLAQRLPTYRANIESKIDTLLEAPPGGRLFDRAGDMLRDLGRKIERGEESEQASAPAGGTDNQTEEKKPIPVEIHQPAPTSLQILRTIVGPLVSPLATAGIVIVFVIFMLLKREDLRDRFIRLVSSRDLPRTTQALDDAAKRVGRYLLMQLLVNSTYAIPIGIGLWLIGLPNPILWGMLCGLLRFVPYIGPIVAAFFPLALAVAVDPGWTTVVLAGAWFIVVELVSNNVVEPWLYGASTGLSPIAIIVAAVVWTWLWGPIGLLLSTPLTVCLVVLGRHVPQLAFLDVLLGSEPVLSQRELLYRRLLVGDPNEATERAEEFLRKEPLIAFYDEVTIPALALADEDRVAGRLAEEQRERVANSAMVLVDNLAEWEGNDLAKPEEPKSQAEESEGHGEEAAPIAPALLDLSSLGGLSVLVAGARGNLDDAGAAMLGQLLERHDASVNVVSHEALQSARLRDIDLGDPSVVAISYLNSDSLAHARFLVRRLRRRLPKSMILLCFWGFPASEVERRNPREATGADRVATTIMEAMQAILEKDTPAAVVASTPILPLTASAAR